MTALIITGLLIVLGGVLWRRFVRSEAEERITTRPQGDWRWPPGLSAETYNQRCRLLLHNHGWRDLTTLSIEDDSITLLMHKDRSRVVMRCRHSKTDPSAAEIDILAALRHEHSATLACLMLDALCPAALFADASRKSVHILRLSDIASVEDAVLV